MRMIEVYFNLNKDLIVRDSLTDSNILNVFDDWLNDPMDNKFIDLNNPYYVINEWNMTQINNMVVKIQIIIESINKSVV